MQVASFLVCGFHRLSLFAQMDSLNESWDFLGLPLTSWDFFGTSWDFLGHRHSADLGRSALQTQVVALACPDAMDVGSSVKSRQKRDSIWQKSRHRQPLWYTVRFVNRFKFQQPVHNQQKNTNKIK